MDEAAGMDRDSLLELAGASSGPGRVASVERAAGEGFMAPLHAHAGDEAVHVVEGRVTIFAGAEIVTLGPGETFVVAEGVAHTLRVESPRARAVFTTFTASAGRYEDFLRATGPVSVGPSGSPVWATAEDARGVGAAAAAANVTVYGPPGLLAVDARITA
ncbi:MAG TPA: cupin domain-containing protein [Gaiellaceae bacterium]|nr:cupin domain-containing protein [Gaiellaceae bacterium]